MPTIDTDTVLLCRNLASRLHQGQTRALTDADFFEDHIVPVAELTRDFTPGEFNAEARCVAYLHDTIEDCEGVDYGFLRKERVPSVIAQNVEVMSHKDRESYATYLRRIIREASPPGLYAKLFDLHQNRQALFDLGYPDKHRQRGDKYGLAILLLREELTRRSCDPLLWIPADHTRLLRPA